MSPTEAAEPASGAMTFVEIALIIFVVVFLVIVVGVLLGRPAKYEAASRIPLDDDVVTPRDQPSTEHHP